MIDVMGGVPRDEPALVEPFDAFFLREYRSIVGLAFALAGPAAGEDIAQEALLRAYRDWDRICRYDRPGAWVRRVTINLATSAGRRRRSERLALERLAARPSGAPAPMADSTFAFWAEVRRLPRRQASVTALHYLEDRSVADIAAVLGVAEGTVKAHLHAARAALARRLDAEEDS
jgi:RNA polymerase sigma-70 factor (ECF subfamily)